MDQRRAQSERLAQQRGLPLPPAAKPKPAPQPATAQSEPTSALYQIAGTYNEWSMETLIFCHLLYAAAIAEGSATFIRPGNSYLSGVAPLSTPEMRAGWFVMKRKRQPEQFKAAWARLPLRLQKRLTDDGLFRMSANAPVEPHGATKGGFTNPVRLIARPFGWVEDLFPERFISAEALPDYLTRRHAGWRPDSPDQDTTDTPAPEEPKAKLVFGETRLAPAVHPREQARQRARAKRATERAAREAKSPSDA